MHSAASGSLCACSCCCSPAAPEYPAGFAQSPASNWTATWAPGRLDHSFERGLTDVSATYCRRPDGGEDLLNRGYDVAKGQWKEARGRAYFLDSPEVGSLQVSFFGPFYGCYHVFALDPDYLWVLARQRQLSPAVLEDLLTTARKAGFATDTLIFPGGAAP